MWSTRSVWHEIWQFWNISEVIVFILESCIGDPFSKGIWGLVAFLALESRIRTTLDVKVCEWKTVSNTVTWSKSFKPWKDVITQTIILIAPKLSDQEQSSRSHLLTLLYDETCTFWSLPILHAHYCICSLSSTDDVSMERRRWIKSKIGGSEKWQVDSIVEVRAKDWRSTLDVDLIW